MAKITLAHVRTFDPSVRSALIAATQHALMLHESAIVAEVSMLDAARERDNRAWLQRVIVKSALSSGAKLDTDIALAVAMTRAYADGVRFGGYDDVEVLRKSVRYGARSVGKNINAACLALETATRIDPLTVDLPAMLALKDAGKLTNMSHKTLRWSLALYDARSRVVTLDVHMCRGIARIAGLGDDYDGITDSAYAALEVYMLGIFDECGYGHMPLVAQWALWNEFRHAGIHASHAAIAV